jgi:dTDP-4-amino-4,6-dideoxygalactose transaminase
LVALWALGVGPGDEVITTALTFFATAGAIVRLGATPVFVDIDAATFNLDAACARAAITSRTRAIVPVHLYGRPADLTALDGVMVPIVEDAAQAVGSALIARGGRTATLSFFPSKNLAAAGDGGMVLIHDAAHAERVRRMRTHGSHPKYVHDMVGGNFRLDALQAAIIGAKLPFLAGWNARRQAHARRYREMLAGTPLTLPTDAPGHVWHQFVVRAPAADRAALRRALAEAGIDTEIYYPLAMHLQPCFQALGGKAGQLPEAERATREVLALPIFAQLDDAQLDFVVAQIRRFYAC